jgi:hypothetical protein
MEPLLLSVFPDACLVMTHRHPITVVPSCLRLLEVFHQPFTNRRSNQENFIAGLAGAMDRHLLNRAAMGEHKILDIDFREVVGSVDSLIEKIYEFSAVPLDEASRKRMLDWNAHDLSKKKGKHVYTLEKYNVSEASVCRLFAGYIEFLRGKFGE